MKPAVIERGEVPVLEIGGSHVTSAYVRVAEGAVVEGSAHTEPLDPRSNAAEILRVILTCGRTLGTFSGKALGVALPGPFDYERGIALYRGVGKFDALYGVDLRAALCAGLPSPPASITFLNDAEAFMWGEHLFGAAAPFRRCVGITLGTGIGSAFFAQGSVQHSGPEVPPDGRVDLLEVDGKRLEEVVSTRAVVRQYLTRSGVACQGTAQVAERARAGDPVAQGVLSEVFSQLGRALRPWLDRFDAEALIVGGAMTGSWDLVGPPLNEGLEAGGAGSLKGLTLMVAAHPLYAALLGAAASALRAYHREVGCREVARLQ